MGNTIIIMMTKQNKKKKMVKSQLEPWSPGLVSVKVRIKMMEIKMKRIIAEK